MQTKMTNKEFDTLLAKNPPSQASIDEAITWMASIESPHCTQKNEREFLAWLHSSSENQAAFIVAENLSTSAAKVLSSELAHNQTSSNSLGVGKRLDLSKRLGAGDTLGTVWWPAFAACFCLVLGVMWFSFNGPEVDSTQTYSTQTYSTQTYSTKIGQQKTITLSDRSTVLMNTLTEARIKESSHHVQVVLQTGEVILDVNHNPRRVFEVISKNGTVRVLGTQFSVKITDQDTSVTVVEGRVQMMPANVSSKNLSEQTLLLKSNQQQSFTAAVQGEEPLAIDAKQKLAWRNGRLVFSGEPLREVVSEINRYSKLTLTIGDSELADMVVMATLNLDEDVAMNLVQALNLQASPSKANENHLILRAN